jgi:hypothetical protein
MIAGALAKQQWRQELRQVWRKLEKEKGPVRVLPNREPSYSPPLGSRLAQAGLGRSGQFRFWADHGPGRRLGLWPVCEMGPK